MDKKYYKKSPCLNCGEEAFLGALNKGLHKDGFGCKKQLKQIEAKRPAKKVVSEPLYICGFCKGVFNTKPYSKGSRLKFCSPECKDKHGEWSMRNRYKSKAYIPKQASKSIFTTVALRWRGGRKK